MGLARGQQGTLTQVKDQGRRGNVLGLDRNIVAVHCVQDLEGTIARYLPALYRVAFRQLRNREDAEDSVQDALLSAFVHISQFEGRSHISTWLYRIVVNSARMQWRRRKNRVVFSLDETADGERLLLSQRSLGWSSTPKY
jgi:DNA-directed RNA polymerase specialized sigma24 family protein